MHCIVLHYIILYYQKNGQLIIKKKTKMLIKKVTKNIKMLFSPILLAFHRVVERHLWLFFTSSSFYSYIVAKGFAMWLVFAIGSEIIAT